MRVKNQKNFFQNIYLDENGNMVLVLDDKTDPTEKGISQYNTFNKIYLSEEGYLKTYEA
tara:strand:- start:239 stop:415 length:177 start_codon:yes stop_codon:yes gene_type:complete